MYSSDDGWESYSIAPSTIPNEAGDGGGDYTRSYLEKLSHSLPQSESTSIYSNSGIVQTGLENFFFTSQPALQGWSNDSPSITQEIDEDDNNFDDNIGGRSYAEFENKLKHGFLEASKLGLVSVPPAIFDYKPPLQAI
ncbi:hypothetical protein Ocin01_09666 [Orchesella cincta]|uniref:Uncharacterized protein n=1 Tax=Orchesella cincta TaxID=48709 RepID=A0A1D2MVN2_ORCCI|nr:hypothetical protein Ocin01_09666 [Orchesella cincta]